MLNALLLWVAGRDLVGREGRVVTGCDNMGIVCHANDISSVPSMTDSNRRMSSGQ